MSDSLVTLIQIAGFVAVLCLCWWIAGIPERRTRRDFERRIFGRRK